MQKEIILDGKKIAYTVKKYKRTKYLRLSINDRGCLVATQPWRLSEKFLKNFILAKAKWVLDKLELFKKNDGLQIFKAKQKEYLTYKKSAASLILQKIKEFNNDSQFKIARVSVRNQKTRWGSCSGKGNLNFNYKIFFLPEKMIDYIIWHELCHLKEANHSSRFWHLVAQKFPNYKAIRRELRHRELN